MGKFQKVLPKTSPSTAKSVTKTSPALHTTDFAPPGDVGDSPGPGPGPAAVKHAAHLNVPGRHAHLHGLGKTGPKGKK